MSVVDRGDGTVVLTGQFQVQTNPDFTVTLTGLTGNTTSADGFTATVTYTPAAAPVTPVPVPGDDDPGVDPTAGYDATSDLYDRLPAIYRTLDALQDPPQPLRRFIAAMADQVGAVVGIVDTIDFEPPDSREGPSQAVSGLADPDTAPAVWLPWIGQLLGVHVNTALTAAEQRDQVRGATSGFRGGTKAAIAAAAKSALTGTRTVEVYDHSIQNPDDGGGQFDMLLVTRIDETPSPQAVLDAVAAKGAKPAGVLLHIRSYQASWATLEAARPTWAEWDGSTWTEIEETGIR